jgi:hypothetical protein
MPLIQRRLQMEGKPGAKTTEFWVALAPVIAGLVEGVKGDQETGRYLILCGTVLGGLYIISRTVVKFKASSNKENA